MNKSASNTTDILLVPSAIVVPDELRLDLGAVPTGMIPLGGEPMLEHIANNYDESEISFVVAVHQQSDTIRQYVAQSKHAWEVIDVGNTSQLSETVVNALNSLDVSEPDGRGLYINFADTLISPVQHVDGIDYVSHKPVERTYRWTTFQSNGDRIGAVSPKYDVSNGRAQQAFVGQFGFRDVGTFLQHLRFREHRHD